ncbi:MAG: HAMP domain-containing sensor histidine kinase [Actinomycetota bacterium]
MARRALPITLGLVLFCAIGTVVAIIVGGVAHPVAANVCRLAELIATIAAVWLVLTVAGHHELGVRHGWIRVAAAVGITNVSLVAADAGVLAPRIAVVLAGFGALLLLSALFAFEGATSSPRAWFAVTLEIAATASVILAAGWVAIEITAPDLLFTDPADKLVAIAAGVLFVLVGCLAAAFVLSSSGRSIAQFALLGGWTATAALTVTWTAVAIVLQIESGPAARLLSAVALAMPAAAAEISRAGHRPGVAVGGRLARAHRGVLALLTLAAIFVFLAAWSSELLTETAAWIAALGLPAAMARLLLTTGENRASAQRLQDELVRSRQRNVELQAARADAEAARDAQRAFLGRTSHELRTPLNAIVGFAEPLEAEVDYGPARQRVDQISNAGDHLLELVEDLLDLQQIEAGSVTPERRAAGLRSIVVEAANQVSPVAAEVDGQVAVVRGEWEDAVVHTDARRVRQILTNLLANGLRHAGGTVTVSAEATAWMVRIHVSDTGPGMTGETLDRIFEPFERAGAEYTGVPGTGLGMSIATSLADALGGRIDAESIVGVGSRFTLSLPPLALSDLDETPTELVRSA